MNDPELFIEQHLPIHDGGLDALYENLTQTTKLGALYIAERTGIPAYSTQFWRPDQPLLRDDDSKRVRYRYHTPDGGRTLTFVGFQEPVPEIPAGTLLRVSLAHWWRSEEMPEGELRCYVQLSGWFPLVPTENVVVAQSPIPTSPDHSPATARSLLKSIFGYDEFWPLQEEIVARVLAGKDTLVVMPTGGGKSLCFQLPALLFDGLTLVISPLISLMQDQVDALQDLGVPAAFLNSTLDYIDYIETAERVRAGEIKLLYTSPETLQRPETLVLLDQCQLDCIAIDEAHCISSWGHDFRPEYRQLAPLRARYAQAVCIALTATATPRVQDDIEQMLGFDAAARFVSSFDRPNLYLGVEPRLDGVRQVLAFLQAHQGEAGIIYCSTRNQVDALAGELQARGYSALPYHAGMDATTREQYQRRFSRDDAAIIVATIAFGMGIDKSNVRFVLHYNLPQEHRKLLSGNRAGRARWCAGGLPIVVQPERCDHRAPFHRSGGGVGTDGAVGSPQRHGALHAIPRVSAQTFAGLFWRELCRRELRDV